MDWISAGQLLIIFLVVIGVWIIFNTWDENKEEISKFKAFINCVKPDDFHDFRGVDEDEIYYVEEFEDED